MEISVTHLCKVKCVTDRVLIVCMIDMLDRCLYEVAKKHYKINFWSEQRQIYEKQDLNLQPPEYFTGALINWAIQSYQLRAWPVEGALDASSNLSLGIFLVSMWLLFIFLLQHKL